MNTLTVDLLDNLIKPEPRLPWITKWLVNEVWTSEIYNKLSPEEYLVCGEEKVHNFEEMLSVSSERFYNELSAAAAEHKTIIDSIDSDTAVVVFDGASLREIPIILNKASESGYKVIEKSVSFAALPSKTLDFVEQKLIGKPVTPKNLPQRKELKEKNIKAYYFDDVVTTRQIESSNGEKILMWSAFPDNTYQDYDAKFARHFSEIQTLFDSAWRNTVMQIHRKKRIIITSDHGYIFFGAGFESTRPSDACNILEQDRAKSFSENEKMPDEIENPELQIFTDRRLAMVRGRIKNRPKGPSSNKAYRHGGLSLMEMIVPWIVIEKER